jgi:hypothetical protein
MNNNANVKVEGIWYKTDSTKPVAASYLTFKKTARYLKMQVAYYKTGLGNTAFVEIAQNDGEILASESFTTDDTHENANIGQVFTIDLGIPDGSMKEVYLQAYQDGNEGFVYFRKIRAWLEG